MLINIAYIYAYIERAYTYIYIYIYMLRIITLHCYYLKNWKTGQRFNYLQILVKTKFKQFGFPISALVSAIVTSLPSN